MRTARPLARLAKAVAAVTIAAAGITLGQLAVAVPFASASTGVGWIRLAHLSPNTPAVDVYLYSFRDPTAKIVLDHVSYGTVSGFEQLPAGDYTVAMRGAGAAPGSKPVLSTAVDVLAGHAYTVAGMGPASGLRLQIIPDRLTTPRGKALVRVIQASLDQNVVTVSAGRTKLAQAPEVRQRHRLPRREAWHLVDPCSREQRENHGFSRPDGWLPLHPGHPGRAREAGR